MKRKLFFSLLFTVTVLNTHSIFAAGYHFLFEPSNEFSTMNFPLPRGKLFAVSDDNDNQGICDLTGKLIVPMSKQFITSNGDNIVIDSNNNKSLFDLTSQKIIFTYPKGVNRLWRNRKLESSHAGCDYQI